MSWRPLFKEPRVPVARWLRRLFGPGLRARGSLRRRGCAYERRAGGAQQLPAVHLQASTTDGSTHTRGLKTLQHSEIGWSESERLGF